jgi:dihydrofolate synthase/folylpolyglutamate synthase
VEKISLDPPELKLRRAKPQYKNLKTMTYKEALDFLYSQLPAYHRIGKAAYKNNLDNTIALDEYFSHPHRKYMTIHVAGTNGKGSVSHMIASVLQEAGYMTGLYTSPHLKDFRERIKINGEMIAEKDVISFVENHSGIIESVQPSFFEMSVAMAFNYFAQKNIDIAVIEAGLGGRLDSTNIILPLVSVITNIGHDHMDLLGNTLEKVAHEKAGIIKRGVPVVIGGTRPETKNIFHSYASNSGSDIYFAEENYYCRLEAIDINYTGRNFTVHEVNGNSIFKGIIPLAGDYQHANLITIFQLFRCLEKRLKLNERDLIDGIRNVIKNTGFYGRWQVLGKNPLIVCDTGHNMEGLEYVMKQIKQIPATKRHLVIGFVSDKDLDSLLPLFPADAVYYFTRAAVPRAMDENLLMYEASRFGLYGNSYTSVNEAFNAALRSSFPTDLIFIGGSTFVVAEVI